MKNLRLKVRKLSNIGFVSHCLLNNLSKVEAFKNQNKELMRFLLDYDVELVQMPCPEFTLYGGRRFGQVKEQYDTPFFRKHCSMIAEPLIQQIEEYRRNGHNIIGVFAIKGSPSCGYHHTVSGPSWMGELNSRTESLLKEVKLVEGSGVFMEELSKRLTEEIRVIEVDEENIESTLDELKEILE